jgi:hypothetical protein
LNYLDLLLFELKVLGNEEVLETLDQYCIQLLRIAKNQRNQLLLAQGYWFTSKIKLLKNDIPEAQRLFTQARLIAEEKKLELLLLKISKEQEAFFQQLDKWQEYITQNIPLTERIDQTLVEELLLNMLHQYSGVLSPLHPQSEKMKSQQDYLLQAKQILSDYRTEGE